MKKSEEYDRNAFLRLALECGDSVSNTPEKAREYVICYGFDLKMVKKEAAIQFQKLKEAKKAQEIKKGVEQERKPKKGRDQGLGL